MSRTAIFPGTFDPITYGHVNIIERASEIFDHVIILVAESSTKKTLFTSEERGELIRKCVKKYKNVEVQVHGGLTVDFVKKHKNAVMIRSLRSGQDFDYEKVIADANLRMNKKAETLFLASKAEYSGISSTLVREIALHGGDLSSFVPQDVEAALVKKIKRK